VKIKKTYRGELSSSTNSSVFWVIMLRNNPEDGRIEVNRSGRLRSGLVPAFLNLVPMWKRMVMFTTQQVYPWKNNPLETVWSTEPFWKFPRSETCPDSGENESVNLL
jgi:hypothetical protein